MTQAIIFGLGSMFNHARDQNVGWKRDLERQVIKYQTLRNVKAGEELCESASKPACPGLLRMLMISRYIIRRSINFQGCRRPSCCR